MTATPQARQEVALVKGVAALPWEGDSLVFNELVKGRGRPWVELTYMTLFGSTSGNRTQPTADEFVQILYKADALGLDPVKGQCIAYIVKSKKYNTRDIVFVVTFDGWLSRAAKHSDWGGVGGEAVCANDTFEWDAVHQRPHVHQFGKSGRGEVMGGWGRCVRKGMEPFGFYADKKEFDDIIEGGNRNFLRQKLAKHMTKQLCIKHSIRMAYPDMLPGVMLPEEMGGATTENGTSLPSEVASDDPPLDRLPRGQDERDELIKDIDEQFTALGLSDDDAKAQAVMRRKKAGLILRRSLNTIRLTDLTDMSLVMLRDGLEAELNHRDGPELAEVVTPEKVEEEPAPKPKAKKKEPEPEFVACQKCGKPHVPADIAKKLSTLGQPVLGPGCEKRGEV